MHQLAILDAWLSSCLVDRRVASAQPPWHHRRQPANAMHTTMGRHNRDPAEDRNEPYAVLDIAMALMDAQFPSEKPKGRHIVSVAELIARLAVEGFAVRLA